MDYRQLGFLGAAGALLASFNCGGSVTTGTGGGSSDSTTDASSSGTGTNSTQSTGTTSVNTSTSVSTSSGTPSDCNQICAQLAGIGCEQGECLDGCKQAFVGPCVPQFESYLACFLDFATTCEAVPPECAAQFDAYSQCLGGGGCGEELCSGTGSGGGETFCSCTQDCDGTTYEAVCTSSAGQGKCECTINGTLVAQCEEQNPSCDLGVGCCSQFFFEG